MSVPDMDETGRRRRRPTRMGPEPVQRSAYQNPTGHYWSEFSYPQPAIICQVLPLTSLRLALPGRHLGVSVSFSVHLLSDGGDAGQAPSDQVAGASISCLALDSDAEAGRPHEAVRRVIPAAGVIVQATVIVPAAVITSAAVADVIDGASS
jgi:hypothetical protein